MSPPIIPVTITQSQRTPYVFALDHRGPATLFVQLPAGWKAQQVAGLPSPFDPVDGGVKFPVTVPIGDNQGKEYNDYQITLIDEANQLRPSTIRVKPLGKPGDLYPDVD